MPESPRDDSLDDKDAQFADHVATTIDGPVLRYAQRLALIKDAQRRGIGRFQANLIIASVLHQRGAGHAYEVPPDRQGPGWRAILATIAVVQTTIAIGIWWLLGR